MTPRTLSMYWTEKRSRSFNARLFAVGPLTELLSTSAWVAA